MADDAGADIHHAPTDHDHFSHAPPAPSRKSTFSKGPMETKVNPRSGTETPVDTLGMKRTSRHMVDIDEYFVSCLVFDFWTASYAL